MFGGGKNGAGFEADAGEDDVKADSKASKPKKSLELLLNAAADEDVVLDGFEADPENGAKGSDPNGSDANPSFAVELLFCFSFC